MQEPRFHLITHDTIKGKILKSGTQNELVGHAQQVRKHSHVTIISDKSLNKIFVVDGENIYARKYLN